MGPQNCYVYLARYIIFTINMFRLDTKRKNFRRSITYISLMSHVTKLVLRIVINRIRGRTLDDIAPVQYGFMQAKGTGNAIFVLRKLVERSVEKQRDVYTCFIDYSKAFDTVKHESLVELLQSLDVDKSETRLLTNLY